MDAPYELTKWGFGLMGKINLYEKEGCHDLGFYQRIMQ